MARPMSEEEIYEEARKRVKAKKEFWGNFGSWAAVNIVLVIVWALTNNGGYVWFLWPLCIWGVFILLHFLRAYVFPEKGDRTAIEKEVERIKRKLGQVFWRRSTGRNRPALSSVISSCTLEISLSKNVAHEGKSVSL